MAKDKNIQVECYSGSRYGEHPLAFVYEGRRYTIANIIRQWRMPEGLCFRILTQEEKPSLEGQLFDLIYLEYEDEWNVFPMA
ncbi:MAG: hypothetical protein LLG42_14735 [Chloroflexi bacterium]|nr:hypothetical protein [Chloroflexota bacterium]